MSERVATDQIESIVGVARDPEKHWGRAVSAEKRVYVLHSQECVDKTPDLRTCRFSRALDRGIDLKKWTEDVPVVLRILGGRLLPHPDFPVEQVVELSIPFRRFMPQIEQVPEQ